MDENDWLARALRGAPAPPARGRLPDARLAERGRRRGAGDVAAGQPRRHHDGREPRRLADDDHARVCLNMLRSRRTRSARNRSRPTCRTRSSPGRKAATPSSEARARRLGRAGAAGRARDARARRAAGLRPPRHVRRAIRRDRTDRRTDTRSDPPTRQPRPPTRAGHGIGPRHRPGPSAREVVDAFFAAARHGDFDGLVARARSRRRAACRLGPAHASTIVRGAETVASRAIMFAQPSATLVPVLVNGVRRGRGRPSRDGPSRSWHSPSATAGSSPSMPSTTRFASGRSTSPCSTSEG